MKAYLVFFIFLVSFGSVGFVSQEVFAQQPSPALDTKPAQNAVETWLAQIDKGSYPEAWKGFSPFFQERMTFENWKNQIGSARSIFGKFESRKLQSATPTTSLPGMADGNYVVVQYNTAFENKKNALETVTVKLEKDGKWGVVGYYIK